MRDLGQAVGDPRGRLVPIDAGPLGHGTSPLSPHSTESAVPPSRHPSHSHRVSALLAGSSGGRRALWLRLRVRRCVTTSELVHAYHEAHRRGPGTYSPLEDARPRFVLCQYAAAPSHNEDPIRSSTRDRDPLRCQVRSALIPSQRGPRGRAIAAARRATRRRSRRPGGRCGRRGTR